MGHFAEGFGRGGDKLLLLGEDGKVLFSRALTDPFESGAGGVPLFDASLGHAFILREHSGHISALSGARILTRGSLAGDRPNQPRSAAEARLKAAPDGGFERRSRQLHAVGLAAGVLSSSLELDEVLNATVEYARVLFDVPAAALVLASPSGDSFSVAAQEGIDSGACDIEIDLDTLIELGFDSGVPLLLPDLTVLGSFRCFAELCSEGFSCALSLPFFADEELCGLLVILNREGIGMEGVDLEAFKLFAGHAANAIGNAENHAREQRTADVVRHSILDLPHMPEIRAASRYYPATEAERVGGDFYDIFRAGDGKLVVAVGDVSGKGLDAAMAATLTKHALQAYARISSDPGKILTLTNDLLFSRQTEAAFVTVGLVVFDPSKRCVQYALAGHPPILHRGWRGVTELEQHVPPLGSMSDVVYVSKWTNVEEDDVLLFYTDGVTEARNGQDFFGQDRLSAALTRAGTEPELVVGMVEEELLAFSGGRLLDDVCFVAVTFPREAQPV